ncbi:hypothetical protein QF030_001465 [Streptomyces rishiriensis]|uniref:Uncharacterized protein n=1 Tax=Streptomyces rishiriensis TaxID=68264 RepID=A0ABU0NJI9_STRRH|nr:hypothetical protein [Streptomyces rishiriensis]
MEPRAPSREAGRLRGDRRARTGSHLVKRLVTGLYGYSGEERAAFVRAPGGLRPEGIPDGAAALVIGHVPAAEAMEGSEPRFRETCRSAVLPTKALPRVSPRDRPHSVGTPASR